MNDIIKALGRSSVYNKEQNYSKFRSGKKNWVYFEIINERGFCVYKNFGKGSKKKIKGRENWVTRAVFITECTNVFKLS